MEELGTDFNALTGRVMTRRQLEDQRKKRGECVRCGRKCFHKKLFKMIPITDHGKVLNGRCLNCNPLNPEGSGADKDLVEGGAQPAVCRPTTREDLRRFSRSQSNLAIDASGGGSSNSAELASRPGSSRRVGSGRRHRSLTASALSNAENQLQSSAPPPPPPATPASTPTQTNHHRNSSSISTTGRSPAANSARSLSSTGSSASAASSTHSASRRHTMTPSGPDGEQVAATSIARRRSNAGGRGGLVSPRRAASMRSPGSFSTASTTAARDISASARHLVDASTSLDSAQSEPLRHLSENGMPPSTSVIVSSNPEGEPYQTPPGGGTPSRLQSSIRSTRSAESVLTVDSSFAPHPSAAHQQAHEQEQYPAVVGPPSLRPSLSGELTDNDIINNNNNNNSSSSHHSRYNDNNNAARMSYEHEQEDRFQSPPRSRQDHQRRPSGVELQEAIERITGHSRGGSDKDEEMFVMSSSGHAPHPAAVAVIEHYGHYQQQLPGAVAGGASSSFRGSGGRQVSQHSMRSNDSAHHSMDGSYMSGDEQYRPTHGILNRGGAFPVSPTKPGVAAAPATAPPATVNLGPSSTGSGGGKVRASSGRRLPDASSRSLDSVSSFGEEGPPGQPPTTNGEYQRHFGDGNAGNNASGARAPSDPSLIQAKSFDQADPRRGAVPRARSGSSVERDVNTFMSPAEAASYLESNLRLDPRATMASLVEELQQHHRYEDPNALGSRSEHGMTSYSYAAANRQFQSARPLTLERTGSDLRDEVPPPEEPGLERIGEAGDDYVEILHAMRDFPGSLIVQITGMQELANLHYSQSDLDTLAEVGGIHLILDAMQSFPVDVELQISGCRAIWNASGTIENQIGFVEEGALDIVLYDMDHFRDDPDVQDQAMATLANLGAVEANLLPMIERGTVPRVVEAMNKHSENTQVQMKGCSVVTNMASHPTSLKRAIVEMGGGGSVVVSMVMHPRDEELQQKALRALRNLTANCDENKIELAQLGGIDAVISAMQVHRDSAGVQEAGAWTLSNLGGNDENKALIGDCGGIDVVIRAMWVHSDVVTVLEWCCRALYMLSLDVHNGMVVLEVGGISAVVNSMQAHTDSPTVQEMGCAILCNLARDEKCKTRIVDEEALDAIVLAMVLHSDEARVQERACQVLLQLAIAQNFKAMHASNIGQLAQAAGEKFPENCDETAGRLLHVLEGFVAEYR